MTVTTIENFVLLSAQYVEFYDILQSYSSKFDLVFLLEERLNKEQILGEQLIYQVFIIIQLIHHYLVRICRVY